MQATFLGKIPIAKNCWQFNFLADQTLTVIPGQFIMLELNTLEGSKRQAYSVVDQSGRTVSILTRQSQSPYKAELFLLKKGDSVNMLGPFGRFTLPKDAKQPITMIAGGVGISPFYFMLKNLFADQAHIPLTLFFSNQTHESAPFIQTLKTWKEQHPNFTLKLFLTREANKSDPFCHYQRISLEHLKQHSLSQSSFLICGSVSMVDSMLTILKQRQIKEENIHIEKFKSLTITR